MVAVSRAWYSGSYTMPSKVKTNQIPVIALYNDQVFNNKVFSVRFNLNWIIDLGALLASSYSPAQLPKFTFKSFTSLNKIFFAKY